MILKELLAETKGSDPVINTLRNFKVNWNSQINKRGDTEISTTKYDEKFTIVYDPDDTESVWWSIERPSGHETSGVVDLGDVIDIFKDWNEGTY